MIRGYWFLYGPIIISILYYLISLIDFSSFCEYIYCKLESLDENTEYGILLMIITIIEITIIEYVKPFNHYGSNVWKELTIGQKLASFMHIGCIIINIAYLIKNIHNFLDKHLTVKKKNEI